MSHIYLILQVHATFEVDLGKLFLTCETSQVKGKVK